jgi:hypothetical protein|tara:strand:- start:395 stop:637 length:243 start_codon:yes stop_codon:yes gene_type:complete
MNFKQHEDGSCDWIFSDEEIKIINKNKKLILEAESLKHIGNTLVKIVSDWHQNFNSEIKGKYTYENTKVKGKAPKITLDK